MVICAVQHLQGRLVVPVVFTDGIVIDMFLLQQKEKPGMIFIRANGHTVELNGFEMLIT